MQDQQPRLMTAQQAAAYLGISLSTLKKLEIGDHLQPYRTPGGHRRYSQSMLDEYLQRSQGFSYKPEEENSKGVHPHRDAAT